jgi:hypothetical protein
MTITIDQDLQNRWAPSAKQIATAKTLMAGYDSSEICVLVPIALHNKTRGFWTLDVDVEPIEGIYSLAYLGHTPIPGAVDYGMAVENTEKIAKINSLNGTGSYAVIRAGGNWGVWEIF